MKLQVKHASVTESNENIYFIILPNLLNLYGAETWKLRKVHQKYMKSFEMWCWGRMERISWTDRIRNDEV